ncbi:hypothetical protein [Desulfobacter curvatus]|uniref:hypothetical protein n=1 Tax=Desulfobacter curvatus TaxID=2290 RepID=UPI00037CCFC6|nr:hypothetical protein [Desulfobacter curvatus]
MSKYNSKIIFIISAGHSGSTLLDLMIGTLPNTISTGELVWLPWQVWRDGKMCNASPKQDICTCLKIFRECPVWSKILQCISDTTSQNVISHPLDFNLSFLSNKKYTEKTSFRLKVLRKIFEYSIINNQGLFLNSILKNQKGIIQNNLILYDSIVKTMKVSSVVDSSKDILRAYAIWKERPSDIKVILLYKDAKSYAASGKHWGADEPTEKHLKKWLNIYKNRFVPILKTMKTEVLTVKYNNLVEQPTKTRQRLAQFIGSICTNGDWQINTRNMHLVAGNPMRFQGIVNIKYDDRWKRELTTDEQKLAEDYENQMERLILSM